MHRKEMTIKRNFQKLRESPGVRYESVGRGFESLPSHQERPEHIVFWSFFFCAWKGLEQHGRAAGEANNSPVGCCLVRGDHRLGMSVVEPELCSGLSFLCVEGTRTARPSRRRGKQQPGGLLFSVWGSPFGNVCRGSCGLKDFRAFLFCKPWVHGFCTVGVIHVRLCRALNCIAIGFRCPLVLAALLEQPIHQELCHRHGGRRPSTATPIRASFCRRTGACRSLSQPLFRISRNQGVTH